MKVNKKIIITILVIALIGVSIFLIINYWVHKDDCCSCCLEGEICIDMCCKCKGAIFK